MDNLYPISFNGKVYHKDDCDDVFVCFYTCLEALRGDCAVYISDGIWMNPNGETIDES